MTYTLVKVTTLEQAEKELNDTNKIANVAHYNSSFQIVQLMIMGILEAQATY